MKIVFAGTPAFAVPSLEKLIEAGYEIALVISQPDRPAGRGLKLKPPPVKEVAIRHNLPVIQPVKFNCSEVLERLKSIEPDLIIVVAYGKIFRRRSLNIPKIGCVNLHASLLPKYRGVAPVNWAIINGETVTGVTTFFMDEGVDTGKIILQRKVEIDPNEDAGELLTRLSRIGADLVVETCQVIQRDEANPVEQDHTKATYAPKLEKEAGRISWRGSCREIHNRIRGVNPKPGAFTPFRGENVKILRSRLGDREGETPGRVLSIDEQRGILVSCSDGSIWLERLQAPGRKAVGGAEFARGKRIAEGDLFE